MADVTIPIPDQSATSPISEPDPSLVNPRYLSGFGSDNAYTVFYEERADPCIGGYRIYYNQTTSGAMGFNPSSTATNICDTHFVVKNWPISISGTSYTYRGWGSVGNNPNHTFYVSNDLTNWNSVSTFTFTDPANNLQSGENIYYGFHDIIQINGNYLGFAESNQSITYIVWSDQGDDNWEVRAEVGGARSGLLSPLNLYWPGVTGPTPTGNFVLMEVDGQIAYGKPSIPGDDRGIYLSINTAAAQAGSPAQAENAFLDPANWTWRDGSTGVPDADNLVLSTTSGSGGHDVRETWVVPMSNPRTDWVLLYTAEYDTGGGLGDRAFGCASTSTDCSIQPIVDDPEESVLPETGFPPTKLSDLPIQPLAKQYAHISALWIEIPALDLFLPVTGVPKVGGGWDVTWLGNQIGYLEGTAFPTRPGNTVLTGHVYSSDGTAGPFKGLHQLEYNDLIIIHAWGQAYEYHVRNNQIIQPNDFSLLDHTAYDWLTLITCRGYDPNTDHYHYRQVIQAVHTRISPEP